MDKLKGINYHYYLNKLSNGNLHIILPNAILVNFKNKNLALTQVKFGEFGKI